MEVKDLKNLEVVIKQILEEEPYTRKDDMYLYYRYCEKKIVPLTNSIFVKIFLFKTFRKLYKIRDFKSVDRVRRRIQSKYPYLKDEKVAAARYEQQEVYIDYALH